VFYSPTTILGISQENTVLQAGEFMDSWAL